MKRGSFSSGLDGYVGLIGESSSLVIACDAEYADIVEERCAAIREFTPSNVALLPPPGTKGTRIVTYWAGWRKLFPQHGPGKNHEREIKLVDWQQEIANEHPKM